MSSILLYSDFRPDVSKVVDDEMLRLLSGKACKIGYIPSDSDVKRRYFAKVLEHYSVLGISDVVYFDLGEEFDSANIPALLCSDLIHLSGGDPERFMDLISRRNFGEHLRSFLKRGGVLLGVSAGAMILSRSLGLLAIDEPLKSGGKNKSSPKVQGGLRLLDFEFYPHFHGDESTAKKLAHYARTQKTTVYACDDSAGLLVENGIVLSLGAVTRFNP